MFQMTKGRLTRASPWLKSRSATDRRRSFSRENDSRFDALPCRTRRGRRIKTSTTLRTRESILWAGCRAPVSAWGVKGKRVGVGITQSLIAPAHCSLSHRNSWASSSPLSYPSLPPALPSPDYVFITATDRIHRQH